jgi:hypothetical protein
VEFAGRRVNLFRRRGDHPGDRRDGHQVCLRDDHH